MAHSEGKARPDEIARVAYAIWEDEGRPEGRDHEHWMKARQLLEEGRAYSEYPGAAAETGDAAPDPTSVSSAVAGGGAERRSRGSRTAKAKASSEDPAYVRPAGRKKMESPPASWSKTDEESDESFPASDPPGNY